ncbi:MAG: hypothetical protein OSJ66_09115 [Clostridia bacterium]|nr:hypothetical protein [Clostridia bacterium]
MCKQKKNRRKTNLLNNPNGITLIALVISIIVMLILAGVSINAIIGDDGIISRTQYSTFLSEMTAVEEAVQMWKAGEAIGQMGEETKAIPANGLCQVSDLTKTERLAGEVGYYRIWSMTETAPSTNVLSSANIFNGIFESELMYFPAGVQDLFYLNNEVLGIESDKTYIIDAATGMIFSMNGVNLKGVSCYSANMATAVMSGNLNEPVFAESEVSGTGTGDKLAGNTENEYLEDGTRNPNYEEYGFQIIANPNSQNIFKLYNNGDLYGKGVKGTQLNTSPEEMEKINQYVWKEWKVPTEIGEYKKIIVGIYGAMYFIDSKDDLWVYGSNSASNKLGLTAEQSVEYTGREAMKVNLNGKKVKKVFPGTDTTFILTTDNVLMAAGLNTLGQLGLGDTHSTTVFEKVEVPNAQNIETVYCSDNHSQANVIKYKDNTFYFAGSNGFGGLGTGKNEENYKIFTQIWNGVIGPDIDQDVKDVMWDCQTVILKKDGTVWVAGYTGYLMGNLPSGSNFQFRKHNIENVKKMYKLGATDVVLEKENEIYCMNHGNSFGTDYYCKSYPVKMELPTELQNEGIKECYITNGALYVLSKTGKLYGTGVKSNLGINEMDGYTTKIQKLTMDNIDTMYDAEIDTDANESLSLVLLSKGGKYYTTANSSLMFGNDILQKNWTVVAKNVKSFNAMGGGYIDKNNNLWVSGDSRFLGLGVDSASYKNIPNYIMCPDNNIKGKAKEVIFARSNLCFNNR